MMGTGIQQDMNDIYRPLNIGMTTPSYTSAQVDSGSFSRTPASGIPTFGSGMDAGGTAPGDSGSFSRTPDAGTSNVGGPPGLDPIPRQSNAASGQGNSAGNGTNTQGDDSFSWMDDDIRQSAGANPSGSKATGTSPPPPPAAAGTAETEDVVGSGGGGYDIIGDKRVAVGNFEFRPMPTAGTLREWNINMIEAVSDSCAHGFEWIKELKKATNPDVFRGDTRYPALESRCAVAVKKCIQRNDIFACRITQLIEQGHETGVRLTSREIL
jgi:hypothetical protein